MDLRVRWVADRMMPDPRIAIIAIDDGSLQQLQAELGRWPWPRSVYADIVRLCRDAESVAIDLLFAERDAEDPHQDRMLAEAMQEAGNVVLASLLVRHAADETSADWKGGFSDLIAPIPSLREAARGVGFVNYLTDTDGILRGFPLMAELAGATIPSLPLSAVRPFIGVPDRQDGRGDVGKQTFPVDSHGRLRFVPIRRSHRSIPFATALRAARSGAMTPKEFEGNLIWVGSTAAGLTGDHQVTSIEVYTPGVEVMAWVADGLLNQRYFRVLPPPLAAAMAWFLGMVAFALPSRRPAATAAHVGMGIGAVILTDLLLLSTGRWLLPMGSILICGGVGHLGASGLGWLADRDQRIRLEELEARKQRFTDMLVHDLRNQVAPVSLAMDILAKQESVPPYLAAAQASLVRMVAMLNTLLDIRRTQQGRMPVRRKHVDLPGLLADLHAAMQPMAARRHLQFTVQCAPRLDPCSIDPELARRILENLLLNAIQHAAAGGSLVLAASLQGDDLLLSVMNDGPLIPAVAQLRLFDLYEPGAETKRGVFGGTGIGLAFCREAAEAMAGRTWLESPWRDGQGVCVHVLIPLRNTID